MATDANAELRALALWHTRRRMVDEMLNPLLEYGPVAVDRVADRLRELQVRVAEERQAFEAFVALMGDRPSQHATVLDLFARGDRVEAD